MEHLDLAYWGKTCYWVNEGDKNLKTCIIKAQTNEKNEKIWLPKQNETGDGWYLGFEWTEPRDVLEVIIVYAEESTIPNIGEIKVEYWNENWPTPSPERFPGARRGWIGVDDRYHGQWVTARGELKTEGKIQHFIFDPLDIVELPKINALEWAEDFNVCYRRTLKLRMRFTCPEMPIIKQTYILGTGVLMDELLEIRFGCNKDKIEDWSGNLKVWNGKLLGLTSIGFDQGDMLNGENSWICSTDHRPKGLQLKCKAVKDNKALGDNTIITLRTNTYNFSFKPADLDNGPIWIKDYGVFINRPYGKANWEDEAKKIINGVNSTKSIYDRISIEQEQTYERASKEIPELDVTKQAPYGRYAILGWKEVKQKFALRYNGEIFADKLAWKMSGRDAAKIRWPGNSIHFRFATGDPPDFREYKGACKQWLKESYLPIYFTQWNDREIEFTQMAFASLINVPILESYDIRGDEDMMALVRFRIRNTTEGVKKALVWLNITPAENLGLEDMCLMAYGRIIPSETVKAGWKIQNYDAKRLRCIIDIKEKGNLRIVPFVQGAVITDSMKRSDSCFSYFGREMEEMSSSSSISTTLLYELELPSYTTHDIDIIIPYTTFTDNTDIDKLKTISIDRELNNVTEYWKTISEKGANIVLPDESLEKLFKTVPWHILMSVDKDPISGNCVVPAATYRYGSCGNEACMQIRLLDMLGYHDYAEKYLDTFLYAQGTELPDGAFASKEGAFVAVSMDEGKPKIEGFGYNLDHGFIMSCLADHYFLTANKEWLRKIADNLIAACDFVSRERKRTMLFDEEGNKVPEYGLLPAGHLEDNPEWRHWFAVNAHAHGGMLRIAKALKDIGHPQAQRILDEAEKYKGDIIMAVQKAMEESPVVRLMDGTYIPHIPTRVGIKEREWGWIREVIYGPLHLVDGEVIDPCNQKVTWILKDLEDNLFVSRQYGRPVDIDKYWFSQGGVAIQANLLNNGPVYLMRDQIKHAIRALYNNVCQHLYPDILVFTEHPVVELGHGVGPFFKTSDEAQFLIWLRKYLVLEDGDNLWLCRGVPRHWYASGNRIEIKNIVTTFGNISYSIIIDNSSSIIRVHVDIPKYIIPSKIYLRVRNYENEEVTHIESYGCDEASFDNKQELIILEKIYDNLDISVYYR